uniref:RxLR effector candidate protein n=1 Tax=Hyaloperonospora arabidopsidis (strain Emoy2) TaxID=559515 RepID=M4C579_HYAAE
MRPPIILLASTAVSVCITGAPEVTNSSTKEADISSSVPFVGDDSINAPANRRLRAHDAVGGEERAPVPSSLTTEILKKTELAVRKLYDGTNRPNSLSMHAWRSVINADSKIMKHVIAVAERKNQRVPQQTPNGETTGDDMSGLVLTAQANHLQGEIDKLPIMKWMTGKTTGELVDVLKEHKFYNTFSYTRVQALTVVLENFNDAMKTKIKLFDTLVGVYGGVAKYARVLSIAKAGVLTGKMILPLQTELVKSLHWETLDDLLVLLKLDLKRDSLTYEALDTVVTCAALRYKLSVDDALYATFTGLRAMYTDEIVKDAIKKG